ncbi:hypothetical protein KR054_005490 [Drosophila jambulina]|nr:hypothetical protein KR054_005490 [Drosophila jambulina]
MSKGSGPLSKLYNVIIQSVDHFVPQSMQPLWTSPAGPRTVFFWAPFFKWGLVIAGLGDTLSRPAQNISMNQCVSLAATGLIWSRYSMVITPKNYSLMSVNVAVFIIQSFLIAKHLKWRSEGAQKTVYNHTYFSFSSDDW